MFMSPAGESRSATLRQSSLPQTALLGYGACALAGTLWSTGFYFGRIALDETSAWLGGALILAAAVALTLRDHQPQPAVILE